MTDNDGATRRFGFVFFDSESEPEDGFASVAGGPARRIASPHELPTDVIWWTNISFDAFFKKSDAWRNPWLRHDKYLVVSPKDVLKEWGMDPTAVDSTQAAPIVSEFFSRIMKMSFRLIRDVDPKSRMEDVFTGRFLREDFRIILPEPEYPRSEAATVIKSGNAWQEFTQTAVSPVRGGRWVMLRKPRISYAQEIFHTPIPRGPFEFYGRRDIRSLARSGTIDWVNKNENPCIAEVTINKIDGDIAPIYGFGNAMEKEKRIARSWVAHPELVVMDHFADIDVKSVYMGSEYDLIGPNLPEPVKDFLSSKYTEISWSAGVVAETLWRACSLGEEKKSQGEERAHTSWQGVWIKGADKTNMFLSSMQLSEKGYAVVSYGLGWVRCAVLEEDIPNLIRDGLTMGLLPQICDLPKGMFSQDRQVPWKGDVSSMAFAQFTLTGNRDLLWGIDTIPLLGRKERKETFLQLMQKFGGV